MTPRIFLPVSSKYDGLFITSSNRSLAVRWLRPSYVLLCGSRFLPTICGDIDARFSIVWVTSPHSFVDRLEQAKN
jgi:hypothetical protein